MGLLRARASMASRYPTSTTSTTLVFLLFSARAFAQEPATNTLQTITTSISGNVATSSAASAFSATPTTSNNSPTSDTSLPSSTSTSTSTSNQTSRSEGFNYYFVIIAGAVACFVLLFLYMGRRRKTRALLARAHSQRALSQDTAGYRSARYGRGWGPSDNGHGGSQTITSRVRMMGRRREEVPEGLNEAGEAPPPYMPGSKPPSLRSDDGDLEMGEMRRPVPKPKEGELPPGYGLEHGGESSEVVARPETAVVRP